MCSTFEIFAPPHHRVVFEQKISRHRISATAAPSHILGTKNSCHQKTTHLSRILRNFSPKTILQHVHCTYVLPTYTYNIKSGWWGEGGSKLAHVSCLTSPVSCLASPVSRLLSHVSYLLSPVAPFFSHVSCLKSPVSCLLSPVSRLWSHVSCLTSPISNVLSHVS